MLTQRIPLEFVKNAARYAGAYARMHALHMKLARAGFSQEAADLLAENTTLFCFQPFRRVQASA